MAADPRSPSLDAAVEEMCRSEHPLWGQYRPEARAEVAQKMSRALEAALPHLQPSGEAQEPSDEAERAAFVAYPAGLRGGVRDALRAAYAVDHPREPSPATCAESNCALPVEHEGLHVPLPILWQEAGYAQGPWTLRKPSPEREKVAEAICRADWGKDWEVYERPTAEHYALADAVLDALREEQGQ